MERVPKKQLALMVIVVGQLRLLATVYSSLCMIGFVGGVIGCQLVYLTPCGRGNGHQVIIDGVWIG